MKSKVQYIAIGAIVTLLIVFGSVTLLLSRAQADGDLLQPTTVEHAAEPTHYGQIIDPSVQNENARVLAERQRLVDQWVNSMKEAAGNGEAMWVHMKVLEDRHDKAASTNHDGLITIPADYILETWHLLDASDTILAEVSIMWDQDGNVVQFGRLRESISYNSFLNEAMQEPPTAFAWLPARANGEIDRITQEQTMLEGREVTIFTLYMKHSPVRLDDMGGALVSGHFIRETFDATTGQPLRGETVFLMADGTEYKLNQADFLLVETVSELPELAAELFNREMDIKVQEVDYHE